MNKVSQEYIEKVISSGTLNEKVKLYFRDHAGKIPNGTRFFLTFSQGKRLVDSVSLNDIDEWEERVRKGLKIEQAMTALNGVLSIIRSNNLELSTLVSLWSHIENTELMVNSIIESSTFEIMDEDKKSSVRERLFFESMVGVTFNMCSVRQDKEGFIEFKVDTTDLNNDTPLLQLIQDSQKRLLSGLQVFKTRTKVIRDIITEEKFNIPEWEYILDKYEEDIDVPLSPFPKYAGILSDYIPTRDSWKTLIESNVAKNLSFPAMKKLMKDYDFSFNMKDVEIHEKEYNNYKKIILL